MGLYTSSVWLERLMAETGSGIHLGLARIQEVAKRLGVLHPPCPVITVAGTNGKGSTVAALDAIYRASGYRAGTFTSPFLYSIHEEITLNGHPVSEAVLCDAFERVASARQEVYLSYFEFITLAALLILYEADLDVMILEVGLGGRLDAVNVMDADLAIITSIAIDHVAYLGPTRETIGAEKAGIMRQGVPVVCGDSAPPQSLLDHAASLNAPLYVQGRDFGYACKASHWDWWSTKQTWRDLPPTKLTTQNMSSVLMGITLMHDRLPVSFYGLQRGLSEVQLPGRLQTCNGVITEIFDVAHNPAAVALLREHLSTLTCTGKTYAVFSMLADKDIVGALTHMTDVMDDWWIAPISDARAASTETLLQAFSEAGIAAPHVAPSLTVAYAQARAHAEPGDRLVIFGSFHTVATVWPQRATALANASDHT